MEKLKTRGSQDAVLIILNSCLPRNLNLGSQECMFSKILSGPILCIIRFHIMSAFQIRAILVQQSDYNCGISSLNKTQCLLNLKVKLRLSSSI